MAGPVVSVIGLVMCIVWVAATDQAANDISKQANETVTISYDAPAPSRTPPSPTRRSPTAGASEGTASGALASATCSNF